MRHLKRQAMWLPVGTWLVINVFKKQLGEFTGILQSVCKTKILK